MNTTATPIKSTAHDFSVIALSREAYMNDVQIEFFRARLLKDRESIESRLAGEIISASEVSSAADPVDRGALEDARASAIHLHEQTRIMMKEINAALARMESGDYGYCLDTGEEIGLDRMMACPTARYSIEAQRRRELRSRMAA